MMIFESVSVFQLYLRQNNGEKEANKQRTSACNRVLLTSIWDDTVVGFVMNKL